MPVTTPSLFSRVIEDHLALKRRNVNLEAEMPIERYKSDDPLSNHPLFKSEEQARLEESIDELTVPPEIAALNAGHENTVEQFVVSESTEGGFWSRSREFDWGN